MNLPVQISFRDMESSPWMSERIHEEAAKLERFFDRITSCRVIVEAPHKHHRRGHQFHVRIELGVPRKEIVVNHEPSLHGALARGGTSEWSKHLEAHPEHKDAYVAIHDAFKEARRQLQDYVRKLRGDVKMHSRVSPMRQNKLAAEGVEGIETIEAEDA